MAIEFPSELRTILHWAGFDFPSTNEDTLRSHASTWRGIAGGLTETALQMDFARDLMAKHNEGPGFSAFDAQHRAHEGVLHNVRQASQGCMALAEAYETMADIVVGLKVLVIAQVASLAAAVAGALLSGGVGAAAALALRKVAADIIMAAAEEGVTQLMTE